MYDTFLRALAKNNSIEVITLVLPKYYGKGILENFLYFVADMTNLLDVRFLFSFWLEK